jgi:plastocyanin
VRRDQAVAAFIVLALMGLVAGCAGDDATETTSEATTTTTGALGEPGEVVMENFAFQPAEITVEVGSEVTWTNQDGVTHTATSDDEIWNSGNLASGGSFSQTFEEPGTYTYFCQIHPGRMQGTVVVEG